MTSHCYKITDPEVVADYTAAREAQDEAAA